MSKEYSTFGLLLRIFAVCFVLFVIVGVVGSALEKSAYADATAGKQNQEARGALELMRILLDNTSLIKVGDKYVGLVENDRVEIRKSYEILFRLIVKDEAAEAEKVATEQTPSAEAPPPTQ